MSAMSGSPSRQVILHVGLPKTGTTYLQQSFVGHRDQLSSHGVSYPRFGQEHLAGHHNLTFHLRGAPVQGADYGDLTAEAALRRALDEQPEANVLLSSEGFSALDANGVGILLRAIQGLEPRVVVYVRRRSKLMGSSWQEAVKHGSPLGLLEYVSTRLLESGARMLRFEQVLLGIAQAFGRDAMHVLVYDHLVEDGVDLFSHFASTVLGIDGLAVDEARRSNQSIASIEVEIVRAVNQAILSGGGTPSIARTARLHDWLRQDPAAGELIAQVQSVMDARGEELDLSVLDGEWLDRDRFVLEQLGDAVRNPASATELFRIGGPTKVRMLRPAELHASIPLATFAELAERVANDPAS